MKTLLSIIVFFSIFSQKNRLERSIWIMPVAKNCIDTLKFGPGYHVTDYDCEVDYTFHDTYRISKDTVIINEKDDSHSEDGGKPLCFRHFYLLKKDGLHFIKQMQLYHGKWTVGYIGSGRDVAFKEIR